MSYINEITPREFSKKILNEKQNMLVHFFSDWCAPCWSQNVAVDNFAIHNEDKLNVVKINVDRFPELAQTYRITSVPTQLLFKNGKPILARINEEEQLDQMFEFDEVA